jgi:DNA-binding transcriptional MerR regulator
MEKGEFGARGRIDRRDGFGLEATNRPARVTAERRSFTLQPSPFTLPQSAVLYCRERVTTVEIPNRSLFRQPEVCEIAQVQSYVLRSWEAEFPDLGVAKTQGGPRVYRRADLELVLRLKHLLLVEGLTLAGAKRKIADERPAPAAPAEVEALDELLGSDARERILQVKQGLRDLATILAKTPGAEPEEFELRRPVEVAHSKKKKPAAKPVAKSKKR